jgi:TolB-like protein/DNA-binding SARP family transcriptional activator
LNNGTKPARWSLRLFGRFELSALPGGERVALPGKRERVLLAYLALSPNYRQQRRKLATLLWGNASDEAALDNLRTCIWSLRKALGDTEHCALASDGEEIVLDVSAFEIDAVTFRRLAAQSERRELEAAANLYSGELLDGLSIDNDEFESWRRAEAARTKDQAVDVLLRLMTQLGEAGETEAAIEMGMRLLRLEPLHEVAVRRLMRLYGESGRRGSAVQLYRALADALKIELDAQPEAETRAVLAEVSRGGEEPAHALTGSAGPAVAETKALAPSLIIADASETPQELPPPAQPLLLAQGVPRRGTLQHVPTRKLNWILGGGLAATMAIFLFYQFAPSNRAATVESTGVVSIAVLPFANLSADPEQEFFADGMTEEITSALAKVPDLQVVGRTSAFAFKEQNKDSRTIGQALGATHLIEGSVRKAGTRVRITAQLIRADNNLHLWTESYDRELTDVFAIQEDIAKAIATSLRVPLGLKAGERLVSNRTSDLESYEQYLRAKALYRARALPDAMKILEPMLARDAGFAPAWALLAQANVVAVNFSTEVRSGSLEEARRVVKSTQEKAEMAAREAIRLDPRNAIGYAVLGRVQDGYYQKWAAGDDLYKQALALDPNEPDALLNYAVSLAGGGHLKEALRTMERLRTLEPFVPIFNVMDAHFLQLTGRIPAAISILEAIPADAGGGLYRNVFLAQAYAATGRYALAADTLLLVTSNQVGRQSVEDAARLLRSAPEKTKAPQALPALAADLDVVYAYVGASDRIMENYERANELRRGFFDIIWLPELAPLRNSKRFKAVAREAGLVDYWRARGWPDLCRPVGSDDFVCD